MGANLCSLRGDDYSESALKFLEHSKIHETRQCYGWGGLLRAEKNNLQYAQLPGSHRRFLRGALMMSENKSVASLHLRYYSVLPLDWQHAPRPTWNPEVPPPTSY